MRFIVFAFDNYYPSGGSEDIYAITETLEEAYKEASTLFKNGRRLRDYVEIFEIETRNSIHVSIADAEFWEKVR